MGKGLDKQPRDLCTACGHRRRLKYYVPVEKQGKLDTIGLCRKCDQARKFAMKQKGVIA